VPCVIIGGCFEKRSAFSEPINAPAVTLLERGCPAWVSRFATSALIRLIQHCKDPICRSWSTGVSKPSIFTIASRLVLLQSKTKITEILYFFRPDLFEVVEASECFLEHQDHCFDSFRMGKNPAISIVRHCNLRKKFTKLESLFKKSKFEEFATLDRNIFPKFAWR